MKTIVLLGIMSVLSIIAYNIVGGAPRAAAQSPDRPVTLTALAGTESSDKLSARLSEYLFLHQTRDENPSVHAMAAVKACPE